VFRFLRNAPVLKSIVEDMEEVGHNAENKGIKPLFMNYSNPMAMNTWYCNTFVPDSTVGLCYGVIDVIMMLSVVMGVKPIELDYLCAGINHMAWFLEFRYKNSNDPNSTWQDAYPLLEEGIKKDQNFADFDKARIDLMRAVGGYYMTESTGAISEYTPYFRKRNDILEEYGKNRPGIEGLKHAADYNIQLEEQQKMEKKFMSQLKRSKIPLRESASIQYASQIINAMETNVPFRFNGNTMNKVGSLITNLPKGCCVEVPIFADSHGLHPQGGITLPTACQALNISNIMVQKAAVEGLLELNKEKIYQAVMLDPNTASICSLEEIRDMVDEMFQAQANWLPKF
jgi:alpha-galactosidase